MNSHRLYLGGLFVAHATCSVTMVLLNKTIAQGLDFPWTVLLIQNMGTVVISYLHPLVCGSSERDSSKADSSEDPEDPRGRKLHRRVCGIKVPKKTKNRLWVVMQVTFFMGTLFLSLKALRFISVPLYVVARNTVPAQTALLERVFNRVRLTFSAVIGLLLTILGAIVYTYGDLQEGLDAGGLAYAVLLTLVVSCCSIIDKSSVRALGQEEDITPVEVNQIRVAVALPVNLLFLAVFDAGMFSKSAAAGDGKPTLVDSLSGMSPAVKASLLLSTLFGFGMGTFNFYLQQSVSAATVQVANILYKLSTTLLSLVTHPSKVAGLSWLGYVLSLLGIALYTFAPRSSAISGVICSSPARRKRGEGESN